MKIAIIGYGKMGHMIEEIALERGHEIVGIVDPTIDVQRDNVQSTKVPSVITFNSEEFRSADVAIEFTTPATAKENILRAWAQGVPVVCGSTGWKIEELKVLNSFGVRSEGMESLKWKEVGKWKEEGGKIICYSKENKPMLVWSSNYSVGVNIVFDLNKVLAEIMVKQPQYTPTIKEIHHIHKLDKPSGTAKTLCEQIQNSQCTIHNYNVPIESVREGEVPGTHIVTWDSPEDTIVLTHIAKGRRGFALGAVLAAENILNR